jgi:fructose-specific component phosphotransferase system IIB-like protein
MKTVHENRTVNKLINIEKEVEDIKDYLKEDAELALVIGEQIHIIEDAVGKLVWDILLEREDQNENI